ncbi:MAG: STAS domain-containing protein [Roseiflexaceae bacterium]
MIRSSQFNQRNVTIAILVSLALAAWSTTAYAMGVSGWQRVLFSTAPVSVVMTTLLMLAYWRWNWEPARHVLLVYITVATGIILPPTDYPSFIIAIPPAVGLILASPRWVFASALGVYAIGMSRSLSAGDYEHYLNPLVLMLYLLLTVALILGRFVTEAMGQAIAARAQEIEAQRALLEQQAAALADANRAQEEQLDQQRALLELVGTLETPAVQLADGVLFAPIVGHLDSRRAKALTARLLEAVRVQRADTVVLDVAGVAALDMATAMALLETVRALRLLGSQVMISGITPAVALALSQQSVSLEGVTMTRSPQDALSRRVPKLPVRAFA